MRRLFPPWAQKQRQAERETIRQVEKGHGRVETRELTRTIGLNDHLDWPHVGQVCRIERTRQIGDDLLAVAAALLTVGGLWLKKIVKPTF